METERPGHYALGHGVEEPYLVVADTRTYVQLSDGSWRPATGWEGRIR